MKFSIVGEDGAWIEVATDAHIDETGVEPALIISLGTAPDEDGRSSVTEAKMTASAGYILSAAFRSLSEHLDPDRTILRELLEGGMLTMEWQAEG